jgi:hypothetical protein
MRKFLIVLVVLGGLLVAADYGARVYAQGVVAGEVRSALQLSKKPSVSFGGWPFLTNALGGELPSAAMTTSDVVAEGMAIHRLDLALHDLTFPVGRLISGGGGTIRAATGHGTAAVTGEDLSSALHDAGVDATVSIQDGHVQGAFGQFRGRVTLALEGDSLAVFGDMGFGSPISIGRIKLPSIGKGVRFTNVRVRGSVAVISVALRTAEFVIPG